MLVEGESTKMLNALRTVALAVFFVPLIEVTMSLGGASQHRDDFVYEQLVTIKGKVQILNHPTLGRTEGSSIPIVFQRDGCRSCLIAIRADLQGNYEIGVGRGRYKVIVRDTRGGGAPSHDLLASDQPRYINATLTSKPNILDLRVVLPPD